MDFDVLVVGGGIAGLYTAYELLKKYPHKKICVLEKRKRVLGGRISSYHDPYMDVEAGAGRICPALHTLVDKLIRELGLEYVPMDKQIAFLSEKRPGQKIHSLYEMGEKANEDARSLGIVPEKYPPSKHMPYDELCAFLVSYSRHIPKRHLQNVTFEEYAREALNSETLVSILIDSYGYYSELAVMNAYDSLILMRLLDSANAFFGLRGGLSRIVDRISEKIREMGGQIHLGKPVVAIHKTHIDGGTKPLGRTRTTRKIRSEFAYQVHCENGDVYTTKRCVCALPKQVLAKLHGGLFGSLDLGKIECGSLCRIYCTFDKGPNGKVWFRDLGKVTVDNALRMMIPIDTERGVMMISYTDNHWADEWNQLYKKEGIRAVNRKLRDLASSAVGYRIPQPKHTQVFYWGCGVGYWAKGADSRAIQRQVLEPQKGLFVCGEHYSFGYQQWIEGALRTSKNVLDRMHF